MDKKQWYLDLYSNRKMIIFIDNDEIYIEYDEILFLAVTYFKFVA